MWQQKVINKGFVLWALNKDLAESAGGAQYGIKHHYQLKCHYLLTSWSKFSPCWVNCVDVNFVTFCWNWKSSILKAKQLSMSFCLHRSHLHLKKHNLSTVIYWLNFPFFWCNENNFRFSSRKEVFLATYNSSLL